MRLMNPPEFPATCMRNLSFLLDLSVSLPTLCDAHKHFMEKLFPRRVQKEEELEIKIKHEMESDDESTFP